jgi:hypothetical protein
MSDDDVTLEPPAPPVYFPANMSSPIFNMRLPVVAVFRILSYIGASTSSASAKYNYFDDDAHAAFSLASRLCNEDVYSYYALLLSLTLMHGKHEGDPELFPFIKLLVRLKNSNPTSSSSQNSSTSSSGEEDASRLVDQFLARCRADFVSSSTTDGSNNSNKSNTYNSINASSSSSQAAGFAMLGYGISNVDYSSSTTAAAAAGAFVAARLLYKNRGGSKLTDRLMKTLHGFVREKTEEGTGTGAHEEGGDPMSALSTMPVTTTTTAGAADEDDDDEQDHLSSSATPPV